MPGPGNLCRERYRRDRCGTGIGGTYYVLDQIGQRHCTADHCHRRHQPGRNPSGGIIMDNFRDRIQGVDQSSQMQCGRGEDERAGDCGNGGNYLLLPAGILFRSAYLAVDVHCGSVFGGYVRLCDHFSEI